MNRLKASKLQDKAVKIANLIPSQMMDIQNDWTNLELNARRYARKVAKQHKIPKQDWEDAEQAGCLAVWKNINTPVTTNRPAFLMRCCRNAVIDLARQLARQRVYNHLPLRDHAGMDTEAPERIMASGEVSRIMELLEGDELTVVRMLIEGYFLKEVQAHLKLSDDRFRSLCDSLKAVVGDVLDMPQDD